MDFVCDDTSQDDIGRYNLNTGKDISSLEFFSNRWYQRSDIQEDGDEQGKIFCIKTP